MAGFDIVQSQLAKPTPSKGVIKAAWEGIKGAAAINGCATLVEKAGNLIAPFMA